MLRSLDRLAPFGPTVLRVAVGVVMAAHGWQKLTEATPAGFGEGLLAGLGVPAPVLMGWVVTLVELVGGIALVVGVVTRLAAALIGAVLVGAIAMVKLDVGLIADGGGVGAELDLALLAGAVALVLLGPGRLSVDQAVGIESGSVGAGDRVEPRVA